MSRRKSRGSRPASRSNGRSGFARFDLPEPLVRGTEAAGFDEPWPIQLQAIPAGLAGRDVLGLAQTGTGKTAAFALPLLSRLSTGSGRNPRALVLAPTRELANQIAAEIRTLSKFTRLRMLTIYGGVSAQGQIKALRRGVDVVVGCPGRVLDLLQQGELRLGDVETFVLDEADHMFDMGFLPDIRRVIRALPRRRQNLLFSATMPKDIRRLADDLLSDPHVVELADAAPAELVDHGLYMVTRKEKRALLERMLRAADCDSAIVFTRTKRRAKRLAKQLDAAGHRAVGLQGNMSQNARDRAMGGFRKGRYDVMVATDIAARGIDVNDVSHVINYDVPNTPEAYTHRIGRTGRAEREGIASTFVTSDDHGWLRATERMIGETIPRRTVDGSSNGGRSRERSRGASGGAKKRSRGDSEDACAKSPRAARPETVERRGDSAASSASTRLRRRGAHRGKRR
ncbi:MAG: DEAD/DEAH box helicase [Gemmatimonadota bacterium]